jgi:hypothetical protein
MDMGIVWNFGCRGQEIKLFLFEIKIDANDNY